MTALLHAYLLHTRAYRESSMLVDVFTAESGRIGAVWRGARRARYSAPQLFQPVLIEVSGAGELKSLRRVESSGAALMLPGAALVSGLYLNELVVRLLPRDEAQTSLFLSYAHALGVLSEGHDVEPCLRSFERALLEALGYGVDYGHDADSGERVDADGYYAFCPGRGFNRVGAGQEGMPGHVLLAIDDGQMDDPLSLKACKRIHRAVLSQLLGNRPLKSRELFLASR